MEHKHIPFVILLLHALENWRSSHDGKLPKLQAEKDEFKKLVASLSWDLSKEENFDEAFANIFKCYSNYSLRDSVEDIFNSPKIDNPQEKSTFWLLSAALTRFFGTYETLPLSGKLPDMFSSTDFYLTL